MAVTQQVKDIPSFNGIWGFITMFTKACHWYLYWATWILFTPKQPISLKIHF